MTLSSAKEILLLPFPVEAIGRWVSANTSFRFRWIVCVLTATIGCMGICYCITCRFLRNQRRLQAELYQDNALEQARSSRRRRAIVGHIMSRMNGFTGGRFEYELHEMDRALR